MQKVKHNTRFQGFRSHSPCLSTHCDIFVQLSPCTQMILKTQLLHTHTHTHTRTHTVVIAHTIPLFLVQCLGQYFHSRESFFPPFVFFTFIFMEWTFHRFLSFSPLFSSFKWRSSLAYLTSPLSLSLSLSALSAMLWWGLLPLFSCVRCCSVVDSAEGKRGW